MYQINLIHLMLFSNCKQLNCALWYTHYKQRFPFFLTRLTLSFHNNSSHMYIT